MTSDGETEDDRGIICAAMTVERGASHIRTPALIGKPAIDEDIQRPVGSLDMNLRALVPTSRRLEDSVERQCGISR